jgi:hypothetical protein
VFSEDPGLQFLYRLNRFSRHFSVPSNKWKDSTSNYHYRRHLYPIAIKTYCWHSDSVCVKLVKYNIIRFALSPYFHANLLKHKRHFTRNVEAYLWFNSLPNFLNLTRILPYLLRESFKWVESWKWGEPETHVRMRAPAQYSGLIYLLLILLKTKARLKLAQVKLRVLLQYLTGCELQRIKVEMIINEIS